jgi:hypothetical protein
MAGPASVRLSTLCEPRYFPPGHEPRRALGRGSRPPATELNSLLTHPEETRRIE